MSQQLDRSVRAYIARGAGLSASLVRPGNAPGQRPRSAYATLLPLSDVRTGMPQFRQLNDIDGVPTGTRIETAYRRTYSLQFYRDGALDLATKFDRWALSEDGLIRASTAFASYNGGIRSIHLRVAGSYSAAPEVAISDTAGGGTGATATAVLGPGTGLRPVQSIGLDTRGSNYVNPAVTIADGDEDAEAVAIGWGFQVELPLRVRRLDYMPQAFDTIGDKVSGEERAQMDLSILYTSLDQQDTGGVDRWECELVDGVSGETITREVA